MAPGQSKAYEKSARLQRQALALRSAADYKIISSVIKPRPDLIGKVRQMLCDLGELSAEGEVIGPIFEPKEQQTPTKAKPAKGNLATADEKQEEGGTPAGVVECKADIHQSYTMWQHLPPKDMLDILHACEPASLSPGAMKPLVKRGCRFPAKAILLELLEFVLDKDPCGLLGVRDMAIIIEAAIETNRKNGRRARDLAFPCSWDGDGLYSAQTKGQLLVAIFKPTGQSVVVQGVIIGPDDNFVVILNFSMRRAALVINGDSSNAINLLHEFTLAGKILKVNDASSSASTASFGEQSTLGGKVGGTSGGRLANDELNAATLVPKRTRDPSPTDGARGASETAGTPVVDPRRLVAKDEEAEPAATPAAAGKAGRKASAVLLPPDDEEQGTPLEARPAPKSKAKARAVKQEKAAASSSAKGGGRGRGRGASGPPLQKRAKKSTAESDFSGPIVS